METINGKVLVFTDLHIGLKGAQKNRLAICAKVIKKIIDYTVANGIGTILFLGDWNHTRVSTENNALNVSYRLMKALAKVAKVYAILGNHDIYMKNSLDINSLVIFKDLANVVLVDKVMEASINGNKSLLIPWLGDLTAYDKESQDMLFGHFDISSKFLIKSYVTDNSAKGISEDLGKDLSADKDLGSVGDLVGDFVDVAKKTGKIFSGHIHGHKEFLSKGRWFSFVGSPYQQNLGELGYKCGFYVIDEANDAKFVELEGIPKHVEVRVSQMLKDNFDFSCIKGNIVHKIYDVDIEAADDAKLSQKINDQQPYEELMPDYEVALKDTPMTEITDESIALIKKSKMEYVKRYVENIDKKTLEAEGLEADKLIAILEEHYDMVTGEDT